MDISVGKKKFTKDDKRTKTYSEYRAALSYEKDESEAVIRGLIDIINTLRRENRALEQRLNPSVMYPELKPLTYEEDLIIDPQAEAPQKDKTTGQYLLTNKARPYSQHSDELSEGLKEPFGGAGTTMYRVARTKLQREREPNVRSIDAVRGRQVVAGITDLLTVARNRTGDAGLKTEFEEIARALNTVMNDAFVRGAFDTALVYSIVSYIAVRILELRSRKINKGQKGTLGYQIGEDIYNMVLGPNAFERVLRARLDEKLRKLDKLSPTSTTRPQLMTSINNINTILQTRVISSNDFARDIINALTDEKYLKVTKNKNKKDGKVAYETLMTQLKDVSLDTQAQLMKILDERTKIHREFLKTLDEQANAEAQAQLDQLAQ